MYTPPWILYHFYCFHYSVIINKIWPFSNWKLISSPVHLSDAATSIVGLSDAFIAPYHLRVRGPTPHHQQLMLFLVSKGSHKKRTPMSASNAPQSASTSSVSALQHFFYQQQKKLPSLLLNFWSCHPPGRHRSCFSVHHYSWSSCTSSQSS